MDKNRIAAVFFLFLIFFDFSNAFLFGKHRKLGDEPPNNSSAAETAISPPLSSETVDNSGKSGNDLLKADPKVLNGTGTAPPQAQNSAPESSKNPEASGNTDSASAPTKSPTESGKISNSNNSTEIGKEGKGEKNDNEDKNASQPGPSETCEGKPKSKGCKELIACIKSSERGPKDFVVLVQNEGEETLKVHPKAPNSIEYHLKAQELTIPKHETKRINISVAFYQGVNLTFSTERGDCVLHMSPLVSDKNSFHLPSYDKLVTPINGAYFLIATVILFVVTWTCCQFRKRRRRLDGIPYQELEMGRPESMPTATGVETAEGWDQGWDDDWDEEHAVKSPAGRHVGNISANGLTARSSNKDGWENDWDD